jgi:uroporphyrinogen-III synthase
LRRAHIVTRGAAPACALYELGVPVEARAAEPTCAAVLRSLRRWNLGGQQVGIQLCGEEAEGSVVRFLHEVGAHPHAVEPHPHAPSADDDRVQELIGWIDGNGLDAAVFTEPAQLERLLQMARRRDRVTALRDGLDRLHVTAVGGASLACLDRMGVRVDAAPARTFPAQQLVDLLAARLGPAPA